ncbi:hypothetical protein GCM10022204_36420 [Microlunatus aurantiacus]|uniref:Uncharacterized protein n=1 Tax=Microlunatus aurantiacus TaxID=446786 RepID=A0ABP7E9K7_9ACTN
MKRQPPIQTGRPDENAQTVTQKGVGNLPIPVGVTRSHPISPLRFELMPAKAPAFHPELSRSLSNPNPVCDEGEAGSMYRARARCRPSTVSRGRPRTWPGSRRPASSLHRTPPPCW